MDLEKAMQFIIERQARHEEHQAQHEAWLRKHEAAIQEHEAAVRQHDQAIATVTDLVGCLAQAEIRLVERMDTTQANMDRMGQRMDAAQSNIDRFLERFDRYIQGLEGNGHK